MVPEALREAITEALTADLFTFGTDRHWIQYRAPKLAGIFELDPRWVDSILASTNADLWSNLSAQLTSTRGGQRDDDLRRVLEWLTANALVETPRVQFIPAHRRITSSAPDTLDAWNLDGAGLVNRLDRVKNAGFREEELKRAYISICDGLATLLEVQTCDYVVPRKW